MHNEAFHDHTEEEVNSNEGHINDWHTRHQDSKLEVYCDNHPDALECRVYDE
ncbi:MAG: CP12 domain-containing protein [Pseudomonadota bacterium]|nr:CP12 domain-containing protein [Pseudomonadota bacterium]